MRTMFHCSAEARLLRFSLDRLESHGPKHQADRTLPPSEMTKETNVAQNLNQLKLDITNGGPLADVRHENDGALTGKERTAKAYPEILIGQLEGAMRNGGGQEGNDKEQTKKAVDVAHYFLSLYDYNGQIRSSDFTDFDVRRWTKQALSVLGFTANTDEQAHQALMAASASLMNRSYGLDKKNTTLAQRLSKAQDLANSVKNLWDQFRDAKAEKQPEEKIDAMRDDIVKARLEAAYYFLSFYDASKNPIAIAWDENNNKREIVRDDVRLLPPEMTKEQKDAFSDGLRSILSPELDTKDTTTEKVWSYVNLHMYIRANTRRALNAP